MAESRSSIMPTLRYRVAAAAIEWLSKVFGLERHVVYAGPDGTLGHAELKLTYFATNRALVVDVDLVPSAGQVLAAPRPHPEEDAELQRLAYEMIRCFVDDFRPLVEPRTGHVRFRMVKYITG